MRETELSPSPCDSILGVSALLGPFNYHASYQKKAVQGAGVGEPGRGNPRKRNAPLCPHPASRRRCTSAWRAPVARGLVGLATTAELHAHFELETHLICGPAFTELYDKLLDDDMRREIADTCLYKAKPLDRIRMIEKDALINAAINAAYCSSLFCYANSCKTFHAKTVVEQAAAFFGPHVMSCITF